ncbi:3-phosphoshikimate 1-carboxyvinyltransferase [Flavobacterium franklandianum]|uniref:3-phosphoshikimate 1-carboxyvinyltransferase n=1 Tax=Flavobacterium franklandianum TaxID=2594430 RepID=A0A553CL31_9FLAO|nr:3-phosphoshikimate 1-carboxyvinyltransferase [Flavobacterium franklandianum]TRX21134.1 3-phosphoshikimate 1-carboxyvinyltransferase [Flavobacterium franklandianum]
MNLYLQSVICNLQSAISITGSKSETNRLLLLQALFPNITLANTSNSDDSEVMQKALNLDSQLPTSNSQLVDIHHAGTAMRFLTAYFAVNEDCEVVLTGSPRMKERPIKVLVEALQQLGAQISYENQEGYPPIRIKGQKITANKVSIPANVSSQYISALLLVAPKLENGIELTLVGEITSIPYIKMTLALLNEIGVDTNFEGNTITVKPLTTNPKPQTLTVESDWSSASYFFSLAALSNEASISLTSYKETSLQGDSALVEIYAKMGVETRFEENKITLVKQPNFKLETLNLDLNNTPDIAQTIVVTCLGLGIGCHLTGLHTLKIKETDRLEALRIELTKLGANISVTNDSLTLVATKEIHSNVKIATYNDHRMAMAFAPLVLKVPIIIENAEVVSKSYPDFWNDLKNIGFQISEL